MPNLLRPTVSLCRSVQTLALAGVIAACLSGCATRPPANDAEALAEFEQTNDPIEPTNRVFYAINDGLDTVLLRPAAEAYRFVVPNQIRTGIHNLLTNLSTPVRLGNDILQGKPRLAGNTAMRFLINTTIGVVGIFDVAKEMGIPHHDTDFGITLALWGTPEGPFLFLPVLGPSGPRDAIGFGVDIAMDPFTWVGKGTTVTDLGLSRVGVSAVDQREAVLDTVDQVKKTALDPYATFRSLYRQHRQAQIEKLRVDEETTRPIWYAQPARPADSPQVR